MRQRIDRTQFRPQRLSIQRAIGARTALKRTHAAKKINRPAPLMVDTVHVPSARPGELRFRSIPSETELQAIPIFTPATLEINDEETAKFRRRLYALNRDNIAWRYRTMREKGLLLFWRLTRY